MSETQVLEFELGSERYCVEIEYVAEIVDMDDLTTVPNAPDHVEGVMDLRGRTTSIVNPKEALDIDETGDRRRIVVLDPDSIGDDGAIGWVVDEVDEVFRVSTDRIEDPPNADEAIRGVVRRDGEFVIWLVPEGVNA